LKPGQRGLYQRERESVAWKWTLGIVVKKRMVWTNLSLLKAKDVLEKVSYKGTSPSLLKAKDFLYGYKPVTVEGKGFPGEVHLLQLLLIAPAGVLHSQVDIAGIGTGCITEDPSGCLPHADAHLLSLYRSHKLTVSITICTHTDM